MCRHCSADPSFRGFDLRVSPLGAPVVFAARGGRFDSGFRSAGWPSGSRLPLFGTHRFGVAARRVGSSAFCFGDSARWLAFGFTASAFRHAPLWSCPRRVGFYAFRFGVAARRVGLRASASVFRHAPLRSGRWASSFFHLPFRRLPSAGWPSGSPLPLFGTHRFGVTLGGLVLPLGGLAFGLTASAFRHAPLRSCRSAGWFFRWAGWPSGSLLPLFGMHRFAPPHCRSEDRRSTPTRHLFHFKTLIPTC